MSTKIFVMAHKKYDEPEDSTYETLQVGRAAGDQTLPYRGDDTEDNISDLNCYYGELTGIYWLWKNEKRFDHIGICHYRRFYLNKAGKLMTEMEYEEIFREYDAIVSNVNVSTQTNREGYAESHNIEDLLAVGRAIEKLAPEYTESFEKMLSSKRSYYANLLVTTHEKFNEYCSWLFPILKEASGEIDVSNYDNYHKRVYGFLSELLLLVWILKNNYKVYEAKIGLTSEKAETTELKEKLSALVKKKDYTKAREVYYQYMKERPDVRLGQSDISKELPVIECILYILEQEREARQPGFECVSEELRQLAKHYEQLTQILRALGNGTADEQMVNYLMENQVTVIAVEVILRNSDGIDGDKVRKILKIE